MAEPYLGEIRLLPTTFPPAGWADCNGQLLQISEHDALFSLIGTTYGGDGQETFALPNLRSRTPIHTGKGAGLSQRDLGAKGGVEKHPLTVTEMTGHEHDIQGSKAPADSTSPAGATHAAGGDYDSRPLAEGDKVSLEPTAPRGGGAGHNTVQPYLSLRYCISLFGIYPTQS
jgi:microcystin-dependent protein